MKWMLLAFAWCTACTTFDPVTRNVCGNGIVEAGEDCDSSAATCVACAVVCSTAADCPNTAYTCGTDDRCHAPSGTFGEAQNAGPFAVNDYRVTDIDQDGLGDVVGNSRSSLLIRHGAASGLLATLDSELTPTQTGPASYGNLDGDASLDIAIATTDGIVAYTSPYGTLSPLDVQNLIANQSGAIDIRYMFTVSNTAIGTLVVDETMSATRGKVFYAIFDFADLTTVKSAQPCTGQTIDATTLDTADIDTYVVNADGVYPSDVVVSMLYGPAGSKKLCVFDVHKESALAAPFEFDITPSLPAATYTTKPILADLSIDADPCPSLLDVDAQPALKRFDGQTIAAGAQPAHCGMKTTATNTSPLTSGSAATIIGRVPLVPAIPGGAPDMVVASDGLYLLGSGGNWTNVYAAARAWSHVGFADLNQDHNVDYVLSGQGEDDLDLLYRYTVRVGAQPYPVFELLRLDTTAEVASIIIRDFDANGYPDIAFTQKLSDHAELDVAYGTSDRPLAPIQVGVFASLIASANIDLPDTADPLDVADDLVIVVPGTPYAGFTFLHGSVQRTMLPYFDPRSDTAQTQYSQTTLFRGTAIGNFVPTVGGGTDHPDLFGIAVPKGSATVGNTGIRGWTASGNGATLDSTTSDGSKVSGGLNVCEGALQGTGCIEDALLFPWHVSTTHDVVLGLDRAANPSATVFDPGSTSGTIMANDAPNFKAPPNTTAKSMHAADLDGDGSEELIAAFAPTDATMAGGVLVCEVDSSGQPNSCTDVAATAVVHVSATATCFDAAPGHFTAADRFSSGASAADLVVVCHDSKAPGTTLYRVTSSKGVFSADVLFHTASTLTAIQIGDVTGDGIDDIVALEGESGVESLVVFAQCSSRDASTCTSGGAQ